MNLYFDEFLVNNTIESKAKNQKIGGFYYNIVNLPPHLRDFLKNVHVLALARKKDIEEFGINEFLRPFVYELKHLEKDYGVNIRINNKNFALRAALFRVCDDTLALHAVLGFLGPSANLFCNKRKYCSYTEAQLGTNECHKQDLMKIKINKAAQSTTGVKEDFHCTTNYVFDCMLDILEGQGKFDLN